MHIHGTYPVMVDDFSECFVGNTRMAARAVTRRYDAALRPFGITSTQLSLMGGIKTHPGLTVSALAEQRGFERTTLTRNLDRLEAMGLVSAVGSPEGNRRVCALTEKGEALVAEVVPLWRQAQSAMRAELGEEGFLDSLAILRRLGRV